ncbi:MAG TPA: RDD family protein [Pseudoxanthomonas sp.]|jgi:uncharacterized RDD family membrane protein YckC|nr:RDD family protein [Pseudoxanthomonas sp.]
MARSKLDTYREVITPEGVALHLPASGPVPRALAWAIDLGVRLGVMLILMIVFGLLGGFGQGLSLVVMFVMYWIYPIAFEALWNGQTLGKRALGLRVVSADGGPLGWLPAITRNLLRTVDMLPFGYAAGLIACLSDSSGRRLGDMVAGTVVIHVGREHTPSVAPAQGVYPVPPGLQPDEQSAIVAFGERAPLLTPARQAELGDILAPLTQARGQAGVLRLYGMANWLMGRR